MRYVRLIFTSLRSNSSTLLCIKMWYRQSVRRHGMLSWWTKQYSLPSILIAVCWIVKTAFWIIFMKTMWRLRQYSCHLFAKTFSGQNNVKNKKNCIKFARAHRNTKEVPYMEKLPGNCQKEAKKQHSAAPLRC